MKKIYSFMLMAAMLLIGTSAWADNVAKVQVGSADAQEYATVAEAFYAVQQAYSSEVSEITVTLLNNATLDLSQVAPEHELATIDGRLLLETDLPISQSKIVLDLGGKTLDMGAVSFVIYRACLEIKNGSISGTGIPLWVYGCNQHGDSYKCKLKIGNDVEVSTTNEYAVCVRGWNNSNAAYKHTAYGVTIDIYGTVGGTVYINGNVNVVDEDQPHINIYEGATVVAGNEANGIYAAGYGFWYIEGSVSGGTGIYAKAGVISLNGAEITGTGTYSEPEENNNGTTGGGSGIVMDGNSAYAGHMELHVTGETVVTSTEGAAVEELVTSANTSQTDVLEIESGEFNGSVQLGSLTLTAELGQEVQINGTITGGVYNSDIAEYLNPTEGALQPAPGGGYQVVEGCVSILNANGLATFSSPNYNVVLPEDLNVWIVTDGLDGEGKLTLEKVVLSAGAILPKETGFILEGTANKAFSFIKSTGAATTGDLTANALLSSDKFAAAAKPVYILHDTELWLYEGTDFKEGKAFLPATLFGAGAPKRIQMVFAETQAVENVEVEAVKAEKFIENGQIFIIRGEKVYNVQGQIVK